VEPHNTILSPQRIAGQRSIDFHDCPQETPQIMKAKTRHRKSYKWRKRCDSSPIAKGRRAKLHGIRNPRKAKHLGGRGL
jgi:hypothetical protein